MPTLTRLSGRCSITASPPAAASMSMAGVMIGMMPASCAALADAQPLNCWASVLSCKASVEDAPPDTICATASK